MERKYHRLESDGASGLSGKGNLDFTLSMQVFHLLFPLKDLQKHISQRKCDDGITRDDMWEERKEEYTFIHFTAWRHVFISHINSYSRELQRGTWNKCSFIINVYLCWRIFMSRLPDKLLLFCPVYLKPLQNIQNSKILWLDPTSGCIKRRSGGQKCTR